MKLDISTVRESGHDIVAPHGEVDLSNYAVLQQHINEVLARDGADVVVDLSATDFLDSTALGALIGGRRKAHALGRSFVLICDRPHLMKLFRMTKLNLVFTVFPTLEEWRKAAKVG